MSKSLKIEYMGVCKKINAFPISYYQLTEYVYNWTKLNKDLNDINFYESKSKFIIKDEETYSELKNNTDKIIKICVNVIKKNIKNNEFIPSSNVITSINENKDIPKNEDISENMINEIDRVLTNKLNIMQESIVDQICSSIISKSKLSLKPVEIIHKDITCFYCKTKDIVGARYVCTLCDNINMCEKCEAECNHEISHILIKIKIPISEDKLQLLLNKAKLLYK